MGEPRLVTHRRSALRWLLVLIASLCLAGTLASTAQAGSDYWECLSTYGTYCASRYQHHEADVLAGYSGSGSLPLFAGSQCEEAGCAPGWIFWTNTERTGRYNLVIACFNTTVCAPPYDSNHLGRGKGMNLHTSSHNINDSDEF